MDNVKANVIVQNRWMMLEIRMDVCYSKIIKGTTAHKGLTYLWEWHKKYHLITSQS